MRVRQAVLRAALPLTAAAVLTGALPTAVSAEPYPPPPQGGGGFVTQSRVEIGDCTEFGGGGFANNVQVRAHDDGVHVNTGLTNPTGDFLVQVCFGPESTVGTHLLMGEGIEHPTLTQEAIDNGEFVPGAFSGSQPQSRNRNGARKKAVPERLRRVYATVVVLGVAIENPGGGGGVIPPGGNPPGGPGGGGNPPGGNGGGKDEGAGSWSRPKPGLGFTGIELTGAITLAAALLGGGFALRTASRRRRRPLRRVRVGA